MTSPDPRSETPPPLLICSQPTIRTSIDPETGKPLIIHLPCRMSQLEPCPECAEKNRRLAARRSARLQNEAGFLPPVRGDGRGIW